MAAAENTIVRSATPKDYRQILDLGLGAFGYSDTVSLTYNEYFQTRNGNPYLITVAGKVVSANFESVFRIELET